MADELVRPGRAGVVDQHRDRPAGVHHRRHGGVDRASLGDIAHHRERFAALGADALGHPLQVADRAGRQRHPQTLGGQGQANGFANALAGAGDQRGARHGVGVPVPGVVAQARLKLTLSELRSLGVSTCSVAWPLTEPVKVN